MSALAAALVNRERAAAYMDAAKLDAVLGTSPTGVRYLSGYWCWLAPLFREFMVSPGGSGQLAVRNFALLPRHGDPCLVLEPLWALDSFQTWVADIRIAGAARFRLEYGQEAVPEELATLLGRLRSGQWPLDPIDALAESLRDRGLADARIGVELEGMRDSELQRLRFQLPRAQLLDCTNLLRLVRAQKTPLEIEALERAANIAEGAAIEVLRAAGPGDTVSALANAFRARVGAAGADFDHFALGPRGLGFLTAGGPALEAGDAMYVDFGCVCDGWFSDSGSTFCVGEPAAAAAAQHDAVRDCVAAGAAAIAPGVRASTVQAAMAAALAEHEIFESFPHGHGLGLDVRDHPLLVAALDGARIRDDCVELDADLWLEPGMVVNLEAPVLTPGVRSVHCERTFLVTAGGCRDLVPQDRAAPICAVAGRAART